MTDWNPDLYRRFAAERRQPFDVLVSLLEPVDGGRVADLGCGPGELTRELHERLRAGETLGIDRSPAMLERATPLAGDGLRFEMGDLATFDGAGSTWDVVHASASLQWATDHQAVLSRWAAALAPGGQLAVQVPANGEHPSHTVMLEVADQLGIIAAEDVHVTVQKPERYAEILDELGLDDIHVRLQVFLHHLPSSGDVVEWMKGTALLRIKEAVTAEEFDAYLERYREALLDRIGQRSPYLYAYPRILMVARAPR